MEKSMMDPMELEGSVHLYANSWQMVLSNIRANVNSVEKSLEMEGH